MARRNPLSLLPSDEYGDEYFQRKIGDAIVFIRPRPDRDYVYEGMILLPDGSSWKFDDLGAAPIERGRRSEDDEDLIDELACSAVSFGSDEGTNPDSYDDISNATVWVMDDQGEYEIKRMNPDVAAPGVMTVPAAPKANPRRRNPAGLTSKGERMYEHIKSSYAGEPRAKEIAARTVLTRACVGAPGLKKNPQAPRRKIAVVKGDIGTASVYRLPDTEEYLVRLDSSPPSHGYYTDDRDDAMVTARYMANEK